MVGFIEAELFLRGISDTSKVADTAIELLIGKATRHVEEYTEKENKLHSQFVDLSAKIEELLLNKEAAFNEALDAKSKEVEQLKNEAKQKFEAVDKAYREQMRLKAPVNYFGDLRNYSYIRGLLALGAAIVFSLFSGGFLLDTADKLKLVEVDSAKYGTLIYFILLASFLIWALRIIIRYAMGQISIANESSEKMVMVKTYLALLEDGKIEKTERELVLRSVFKSSTYSAVADEHPHPVVELASRLRGK